MNSKWIRERQDLLHKLNEERVAALRREFELTRDADKEALKKVEIASEKRFESVNEFRAQLALVMGTLMPRAESEARLNANADKISALTDRQNKNDGKGAGLQAGWAYLIAAAGIIAAILTAIFTYKPH